MTLFGEYELLEKIAEGGMAEIFLARQSGSGMGFGRPVVVKRMLPELGVRKDFVQMFLDEGRLAANITHPNVVQVFNLGEVDGAYFMAMELVDGPHLGALFAHSLRSRKPLPIEFCVYAVARAADGLHYAHDLRDQASGQQLNIVHRDISPQNILVSKHGDVKVTDFGVAKASTQEAKTRTGVIKGKVSYMSPEQCLGEDLDRRTDVFALGVVLYELLTRRRLFREKSDLLTMQRITTEVIKPPSQLNPKGIDDELDRICAEALARPREERFATAAELSEALDVWLALRGHGDCHGKMARWMEENASDLGVGEPDPGSYSGSDLKVMGTGSAVKELSDSRSSPNVEMAASFDSGAPDTVSTPALNPALTVPNDDAATMAMSISELGEDGVIPTEQADGDAATLALSPSQLDGMVQASFDDTDVNPSSDDDADALATPPVKPKQGLPLAAMGGIFGVFFVLVLVVAFALSGDDDDKAPKDGAEGGPEVAVKVGEGKEANGSAQTPEDAAKPPPAGETEKTPPDTKPEPTPEPTPKETAPESTPPEQKPPEQKPEQPPEPKPEATPPGTKPKPRKPRKPKRPVVTRGPAKLTVYSRPWVNVSVGGKKLGPTPAVEKTVTTSGRVNVRLSNPDLGLNLSTGVSLKKGTSMQLNLNFEKKGGKWVIKSKRLVAR